VLAARARLVPAGGRPAVVLVHGAANASGVWARWQDALAAAGWSSYALDLRGHGASPAVDLGSVGMADYADDVRALAGELARPPVLLGWSMGGLVALMVAAGGAGAACVGLAPSPPARQVDPAVPVRAGVFGPEEYGIASRDPEDQPTMPDLDAEARRIALATLGPESRRARDERKAGVVVDSLPCPALVVAGTEDASFPPATYGALPFAAERIDVPGTHWGLVLGRRTLAAAAPRVLAWLERVVAVPGARGAAAPGSSRR
jgi:pimeloyl-ACP methyl ester carboxylesterase